MSLTKAAADGDDIFKADVKRGSPFGIAALPAASPAGSADKSSRAARSLRSQQTVPSHCDQPNLVFSHQHSKTPSHAKTSVRSQLSLNSAEKGGKVPYPFLTGLLDCLEGSKSSKRVLFAANPRAEILQHITKQIHDKKQQKDLSKVKKLEQEQSELK